MAYSRVPHGTRGLKYEKAGRWRTFNKSGSTRDPWIEMVYVIIGIQGTQRRVPHGTRGLK